MEERELLRSLKNENIYKAISMLHLIREFLKEHAIENLESLENPYTEAEVLLSGRSLFLSLCRDALS